MKRLIYLLIILILLLLAPFAYAGEKHPCEENICVAQFKFGNSFSWGGSAASPGGGDTGPSSGDGLLLETGDFLLLEDDSYLLME